MSIIAATSAVAGAINTRENAKRQERAILAASAQRDKELLKSNSIKGNARVRAARAARARLKASAAESGVQGNSIDSLLANEDFTAGLDIANLNLDLGLARNANRSDTQSRLNSIQQPDYIGTAFDVADATYAGIQRQKDK